MPVTFRHHKFHRTSYSKMTTYY